MTIWLPMLWSQLYVTVLVNTLKEALRPQRANIPSWSVISNPKLSRNPNQNSLFSAAVHLSVWSAALCFLSTLDLLLFTQFLCPPVTPTTLILHQPVFSGCCPLPNRLCIFPSLCHQSDCLVFLLFSTLPSGSSPLWRGADPSPGQVPGPDGEPESEESRVRLQAALWGLPAEVMPKNFTAQSHTCGSSEKTIKKNLHGAEQQEVKREFGWTQAAS